MSTNHEHITPQKCEHALKHCAQCDCAYCTTCGKEWRNNQTNFYPGFGGGMGIGGITPLNGDSDIVLCNVGVTPTTHTHG